MAIDSKLCWKYITHQVIGKLKRFFPEAAIELSIWDRLRRWLGIFRSGIWGGITKYEAKRNVNALFHLHKDLIVKNSDGFHYIGRTLNDSY